MQEILSDMVIDDELICGFLEKLGWILLKLAVLKDIPAAPSKEFSKAYSVISKSSEKKASNESDQSERKQTKGLSTPSIKSKRVDGSGETSRSGSRQET